tara:strand:+ start:163 stop:417 length:255 start_codon:yes stop_codon:yes gene_type:complete
MSKAFNIATNLGAYQSAFDSSGNINVPMYSNHDTTEDVVVVANTNSLMPGPITANNVTVSGHLIVVDEFHVTSNIAVTGSVSLI